MTVYTFIGIKNTPDSGGRGTSRMTVNVQYNPDSNEISASTYTGGVPSISYDDYVPDTAQGALIYENTINGKLVKVFYQKTYPFGYVESAVDPNPPVPVIVIDSINATPQSEQGKIDGTATINASGGTGPYVYSLDGVNYQSSNVFNDLPVGNYTAFVKSNVNPVTTRAFTIEAAPFEPPVIEPEIRDIIALSDAEVSIQNAYKRVEVLSEFGKVPGVLYNGDFEQWDGQNFNFWTRYGGLDFTRIQRSVTNAAGNQVSIENHALRFNKEANSEKFLRSAPIIVGKGDTLKMQYNADKTDTENRVISTGGGVGSSLPYKKYLSTYYRFKFKVACVRYNIVNRVKTAESTWYLYNPGYGSSYEWVISQAYVNNLIDNNSGDISNFTFSLNIPECPVDGELFIDLHGFDKVQVSKTTFEGEEDQISDPVIIPMTRLIAIDDIMISKSSKVKDSDVVGILSVSENLRYYTEKPDQIKILFGDHYLNSAGTVTLGNMYAIKVSSNNSKGWYEYGATTSPIAFGLALAKSILRAYQKPFRFWVGSLKLKPLAIGFSYLDTYRFNVPGQQKFNNKIFSIMGGDIDLKFNTMDNVKLAEIFDRPGKSNDITVPTYPDSTPPVFVQDPTGDSDSNGIFTDQFKTEFS